MQSPDVRIARLAERQHGIVTRAQARDRGLSDDAIDGRVGTGRWLRVHRGVFKVAGASMRFEGWVLAAVLAAGSGAAASQFPAPMATPGRERAN